MERLGLAHWSVTFLDMVQGCVMHGTQDMLPCSSEPHACNLLAAHAHLLPRPSLLLGPLKLLDVDELIALIAKREGWGKWCEVVALAGKR